MSIKARFTVSSLTGTAEFIQVKMVPVYSSDKSSPNYSFSQATPSGAIELGISNKAVFDQFAIGKVFDIDFTEYVAAPTA